MKKTLFLHIGTHKTASTSIQRFLYENRDVLGSQGIAFPIFTFRYQNRASYRNGMFLTWPFFDIDGNRDRTEEDNRFSAAMEEIHRLFEQYHTVILTDEALWRNLYYKRPEVLQKLREDGIAFGYTIQVIVYLRRQDQLIESMWNQNVKMHSDMTEDFDTYVGNRKLRYLDYYDTLAWMGETLGDERLTVRRFENSIREGIIADFAAIVGLDLTEDFWQPEGQANIGLYGNTVYIKQQINRIPDLSYEEGWLFRNALTMISPQAREEYPCSEFSEETRRAFMRRYAEGNAALAKRFFDDGRPLFSEDYSGKARRETDNPWMLEDIIRSAAAADTLLYRRQTKHLESLRHADEIMRNREKEMLIRLKDLERTVRRQEKQIASLQRRMEHMRHPLRRLLEKLRAWYR